MSTDVADAIIVAAGQSRRMGGGTNKLLRPMAGRALLERTLTPFQMAPEVRRIVVVLREEDRAAIDALIRSGGFTKARGHYALGGSARADSVKSGLETLQRLGVPEWVLVQDGARPFVRPSMIGDSLEAAAQTGAAIVAIPLQDTLKEAGEDRVTVRTLDRRNLWQVQTPQTFRFSLLWEAYQKIPAGDRSQWTDDAMLLETQGIGAVVVPGDLTNLKVTTPEDFAWAEFLLRRYPELSRLKV